jgi:hypothetical protein
MQRERKNPGQLVLTKTGFRNPLQKKKKIGFAN